MKKIFFIAVCSLAIFTKNVHAQTDADGAKAMMYEKYVSAKNIYAGILKANLTDPEKWFNMGEAYFYNEQFDSAKIMYQSGAALNARFQPNQIGLAKCMLVEGKKDEALKTFAKVLDIVSSKDIPTAVLVAKGYISDEKNGMPDLAIDLMKKKIELNDKSAAAYETLGDAYKLKN
ncbi:MAG: hypothetical protein RI955_559, partial [Bacteroidota bacterium]